MGSDVIRKLEEEQGVVEAPAMDLPESHILQEIWKVVEYPDSSHLAKVFACSSVTVIFLSTVLFVIETLPALRGQQSIYMENNSNNTNTTSWQSEQGGNLTAETSGFLVTRENAHAKAHWLSLTNTVIIIWFTSEFLIRLVACPDKLLFWTNLTNLIDISSVLPYYIEKSIDRVIGPVRVFRVLRILKLSRHSAGMQLVGRTFLATFPDLLMAGGLLAVLVLIYSSLIYYAESSIPGTKFQSIPHAAWWAVVTLTTVGYGDMAPKTVVGRLVGSLTLLSGTLVLSLPLPSVVANFTYFLNVEQLKKQMKEAKQKQKEKQLEEDKENEERS